MNKKQLIKWLFVIIAILISVVTHIVFPESIIEILDNSVYTLLLLFVTIVLIVYLINAFRNKKTISNEDKKTIKELKNKISSVKIFEIENIDSEDHWYIHDELEFIINLCDDFLKGHKLYEEKESIKKSVKELEQYIRDNNIKELRDTPKEINNILNIIFKYYNNKGNFIKGGK
ncbi:MAG: hypothetical protein ACI4WW_00345 [Candidatus Coprovivens sp.]